MAAAKPDRHFEVPEIKTSREALLRLSKRGVAVEISESREATSREREKLIESA